MSSFIDVDYTEFEKAASAVEEYLIKQKQKMADGNQTIITLGTSWQGDDYNQLESKWNEMDDSSSTAGSLQKSLNNYAEMLRYVADQYKNAQKKAIDRANSL
jgi:uncharacterized protein YukE